MVGTTEIGPDDMLVWASSGGPITVFHYQRFFLAFSCLALAGFVINPLASVFFLLSAVQIICLVIYIVRQVMKKKAETPEKMLNIFFALLGILGLLLICMLSGIVMIWKQRFA